MGIALHRQQDGIDRHPFRQDIQRLLKMAQALLGRDRIAQRLALPLCRQTIGDEQNVIRASTIALLSLNRFKINDTVRVTDLIPLYIRKSDAEIRVAAKSVVQSAPTENAEAAGQVKPKKNI